MTINIEVFMLPKSVINYCNKHNIRHEMETATEALFYSPEGFVFSTESSFRLVELEDEVGRKTSASEIKDRLYLFPKY